MYIKAHSTTSWIPAHFVFTINRKKCSKKELLITACNNCQNSLKFNVIRSLLRIKNTILPRKHVTIVTAFFQCNLFIPSNHTVVQIPFYVLILIWCFYEEKYRQLNRQTDRQTLWIRAERVTIKISTWLRRFSSSLLFLLG